ncbi:hypothetical protein GCM10010975_20960 [Comamonas phosphati]|nr:hypothetical protein GCM10010975_20960 [Comamonas phosphati]
MLAPMMFEFADSEVAELEQAPQQVRVRFAAGRVFEGDFEGGKTGSGRGQWRPLLLICERPVQVEMESGCFGRLAAGTVMLDGQRSAALPVPLHSPATFLLELEFASGARCRVQGRGLELRALASQCSVDSYQC